MRLDYHFDSSNVVMQVIPVSVIHYEIDVRDT